MGCIETKIHSYEGFISSYERKLRLNLISMEEIKLAFFEIKTKFITLEELENVFSNLSIHILQGNNILLYEFISFFQDKNDLLNNNLYNIDKILIILALLSKDPLVEKISLLFDVFDLNRDCLFSESELKIFFFEINNLIFSYSTFWLIKNGILESDSQKFNDYRSFTINKSKEIWPDFLSYMIKAEDTLTKRKFLKHISKLSLNEKLLDYSSMKSIRKTIMPYFINEKIKL